MRVSHRGKGSASVARGTRVRSRALGSDPQGASRVEEVAHGIVAITENVRRMKGMVEDVRQASEQQAQGIDQVTQTLAQMESVTQTTAATAEESAAASEQLNAQAESSMAVVNRLEAMVGVARRRMRRPMVRATSVSGVQSRAAGVSIISGAKGW